MNLLLFNDLEVKRGNKRNEIKQIENSIPF